MNTTARFLRLLDRIHQQRKDPLPALAQQFSGGALRMLQYLLGHPGASVSELADHTGLAVPSVSLNLKKLEKAGYCYREESDSDKRVSCLYLTAEARVGLAEVQKYREENMARVLGRLTAAQQQTMDEILNILLEEDTHDRG